MMQFSYSRVGTYHMCPYKFKLQYIDEVGTLPDTDPTNALYLGTAMHTGIEKGVKEALVEYFNRFPVIDDVQVNEAMKLEHLIPIAKALIPDGEFEVKIETEEFKGFIDLLVSKGNGHYDIYDFKYSNNVDRYLESQQLHVYKYYYEMTHPNHVIDNLFFVFIPKTQIRQKKTEDLYQFRKRLQSVLDEMEVQVVKVDYNPDKVSEYLSNVDEIINATEYPKHCTKLCNWCEFNNFCNKGDTTMITLPDNKWRAAGTVTRRKIWIYGAPFSGKTYLADKFPDPFIISTDGNVQFVTAPFYHIKKEVKVTGRIKEEKHPWEVFKDVISELEVRQNQEGGFKTIVLDLLEDTLEHCRKYMNAKAGVDHEADVQWGKQYDVVRQEFLDTIKRLLNLDYENIIILSHEDATKAVTNRAGGSVTTFRPNIQEKLANKVSGMVDIVGRLISRNGGEQRILSFKEDEHIFGGGRLNIKGVEIPPTYEGIVEIYNNANA